MNVEEAADYLRMPLNTLYMKLQKGEVPGMKPGKRWVLFSDELDKWLEANRKNAVPLTVDEENEAILRTRQSSVRTDGSRTSLRGMINQIVEPLTFYDYEIT